MKSAVSCFANAGSFADMGRVSRSLLVVAAVSAVGMLTAGAQEITGFPQSGTYYVDGSTPVDARTRDLVDAYMAQRRTRQLEEAARRDSIKTFEYHGNTLMDQQFGRF